jgi:aldose 1-epimerase
METADTRVDQSVPPARIGRLFFVQTRRERIQLVCDRARADIDLVGGSLAGLWLDGDQVSELTPAGDRPFYGNGIVMAPWPNRVRDGVWMHQGSTQRLKITEPQHRNAIHGLLRDVVYEVDEHSSDGARLRATIAPQDGWPFELETSLEYQLTPQGLTVTHSATNRGNERAPWAVGMHPYFRIGTHPIEELELRVDATAWVQLDERLNPIATRPVAGTEFDLRQARPVGGLSLNTNFTGFAPGDVATLAAPSGEELTLWLDSQFRWMQAFTPRDFPGGTSTGLALALEPMSAPADALNSGEGLSWLEPGASWHGSWGVRYRRQRSSD